MKKAIVFVCFFAGAACFISAGLYINKQNAGLGEYVEEPVTKVKSPELLSEINMTQYVSLPASFSDIDITEDLDNIEVTEDNVDDVMYDQLKSTASHLGALDADGESMICDYTITQDNTVQEVKTNYMMGYSSTSKIYDENVFDALTGAAIGVPVHIENVSFNGYDNATVDITISNIFKMPYPVTDDYVSQNTEYDSVFNMRQALMNDSSGKAKEMARTHTINSLIDTMMSQTTFIKLPESLIMKELETLQKDDPNTTYDEAKHSLYKIFFIASVIKNYDVATKTDIEKRYAKLDPSETEGLSEYEIERKKYLLFEEDVVTCIYKKVQISNEATAEEPANTQLEETDNTDSE